MLLVVIEKKMRDSKDKLDQDFPANKQSVTPDSDGQLKCCLHSEPILSWEKIVEAE